MSEMIRKQLDCVIEKVGETEQDKRKIFRFIGSASEKDRFGDIIEVEGWDTSNWEKNPVILWAHNHRELPIGKGVAVQKNIEKQALVVDVEFVPKEINPFAGLVSDLVENGFIRGVSVGFLPLKEEPIKEEGARWPTGTRYKKVELLEFSVVNVPMHPSALLLTNSVTRDLFFEHGLGFEGGEKEKEPTTVQTIICSKSRFKSADEASSWCTSHDFKASKVDETEDSYCFRQKDPGEFDQNSLELDSGVKVVIGN